MSFQAYLDKIEERTGRTPAEMVALAHERGFDLGRGHAMALVHVIKNGAGIGDKHVGSTGVHRDLSATLRLDGVANRQGLSPGSTPSERWPGIASGHVMGVADPGVG